MDTYPALKQQWLDRIVDLLSQADDVLSNSSTRRYVEETFGTEMTDENYDTVKANNYYLEVPDRGSANPSPLGDGQVR